MIPDADASATRDGIFSTLYSSSFARNGSLSMWAKSTDVAERSTPDFPLACVLLKVSPALGLGLVVAVSCCGTSGATPTEAEGATPGEAVGETPDEIKVVAPDDDNIPASCGGVPASDDGVAVPDQISPVPGDDTPVPADDAPVSVEASSARGDDAPAPGEDTPASVDDAPAVVDDLSSPKGLLERLSLIHI